MGESSATVSSRGSVRVPHSFAFFVLFAEVLAVLAAPAVDALTITTRYTYNADGAMTAITTQVGEAVETTYLTWDNFVPDADDPTTGTPQVGNGTLSSFGPSPGAPPQFQFDARNRLTGYTDGTVVESFDYRANGTLATSTVAEDARRFYFDNDRDAAITNLYQDGQGLWSSYLERNRYLSDGGEQVLLQPRKDVAVCFDAQSQSLQSYAYDGAYGSQPDVAPASGYDLRDNPMQYAGEYRDPFWGGYYLRARWYHPDLPAFISRDPQANLNRYGYAGGNAVMRVDPSGMSFFGSIQHGAQELNSVLNRGVLGHFARFFLAPMMFPLQLVADPKGFWGAIKHDKGGIDIFLGIGVAVEIASFGLEGAGASAFIRNIGPSARFGIRLGIDSGLGVAQAVTAGAQHGFHHFDWETFAENLELSLGTLRVTHLALGVGYHPFALKSVDVLERIQRADPDSVLIFRERTQGNSLKTWTSPAMEMMGVGRYHERIIAVTRDFSVSTELGVREGYGFVKSRTLLGQPRVSQFFSGDRAARYQYVGSVSADSFSREAFAKTNPRGLLIGEEFQDRLIDEQWQRSPQSAKYKRWTNNCHSHARAVLSTLEFQ